MSLPEERLGNLSNFFAYKFIRTPGNTPPRRKFIEISAISGFQRIHRTAEERGAAKMASDIDPCIDINVVKFRIY